AWVPSSQLLASGRTRTIAWIRVAELGPYLVAAWILTERFGVIGAAFVWSAGCAVDSVLLFGVTRRLASLPWLPLTDRRLRSLAGPAALGGAAMVLAHVASGLTARLAWAGSLALAYGAAVWCLVLTSQERRGITALVGSALGGNRSAPRVGTPRVLRQRKHGRHRRGQLRR
ncbi:MAG TPA: polysaccharide biosynthesis C-terminal domain-containing protein, partial [Streptosporangiaceae bacterium]